MATSKQPQFLTNVARKPEAEAHSCAVVAGRSRWLRPESHDNFWKGASMQNSQLDAIDTWNSFHARSLSEAWLQQGH